MAGHTTNSGCGYNNQSGRTNTHYAGSCCEWCDDLAQGRAIGNTPPVGELNGEPCADYMCGNPNYCPGRGYGPLTSRPAITTTPVEQYSNYTSIPLGDFCVNNPSNPLCLAPDIDADPDVEAGRTVRKVYGNTCGPFPDTGNCGEAMTIFTGITTGQAMKTSPRKWEVNWGADPSSGIPIMTYVTADQLQVYGPGGDLTQIPEPNTPFYTTDPTTTTITTIKPQTAGMAGGLLPIVLIAGAMFYLYNRDK